MKLTPNNQNTTTTEAKKIHQKWSIQMEGAAPVDFMSTVYYPPKESSIFFWVIGIISGQIWYDLYFMYIEQEAIPNGFFQVFHFCSI